MELSARSAGDYIWNMSTKMKAGVLAWLLGAGSLLAHEFWFEPTSHFVEMGGTMRVALRCGMNFAGDPRPLDATLVSAVRRYDARGVTDLMSRLGAPPTPDALALEATTSGTVVLALDTFAKSLTLPGDRFTPYLQEEGLDGVIAARRAAGKTDEPGRERYRRCIKTLIQVGDVMDRTFSVRTGQRLEIVPLANPFAVKAGETLMIEVTFDGRPLPGALVRAWHRGPAAVTRGEARTDAAGRAEVRLGKTGEWMLSLVHMVPVTDDPAHDWDSYWGNLTFALPTR